jgi:putative DNA primase/helicase
MDDGAALAQMEADGLYPSELRWDGRTHRCKAEGDRGSKKSGWYVAHADEPPTVVYGNWRDGHPSESRSVWTDREQDQMSKAERDSIKERQREARKQRDEEDRKRKARAARRYSALWAAAGPAVPSHPYAERKGIRLTLARQSGLRLLVPMRSLETREVLSVQAIGEDGFKRFAKGGQASRVYCGIGTPDPQGRIYVCEGYATGETIHAATGAAVTVSFTAGNLPAVAQFIHGLFPSAELIIAADNDQWTSIRIAGKEVQNPGLHYAREAGQKVGAAVVVPQFASLDGKPTDFNDLATREGESEARVQLSPAVTGQEEPDEAAGEWTGDDGGSQPFRCLGFDAGIYYYMASATGQITPLSAPKHEKRHLLTLAPYAWWEANFPAKEGTDWTAAADWMLRTAHQAGIFTPGRIHGRGCWRERSGIITHLGDRMILPSGEMTTPQNYHGDGGRYVYQRQRTLTGPSSDSLGDDDARRLLELFQAPRWEMPASGVLLAGWTALAPVCGALEWRPHVWVTGGRGSGKSTILDDVVAPLLADMHYHFQGETTEAGIRQTVEADALPVMFDEAEKGDGQRGDTRMDHIVALARQASTETQARVAKGSAGGQAINYSVRSMFLMSSIGVSLAHGSDQSRFVVLTLRTPDDGRGEDNQRQWEQLQADIAERVTEDAGRRLIARTIRNLPDILTNAQTFRRVATMVLGSARMGDQYGYLLAGAWSLGRSGVASEEEARAFVERFDWDTYTEPARERDEEKCLASILQQPVAVDTSTGRLTLSVGELVEAAAIGGGGAVEAGLANKSLGRLGLRVERRADGNWLNIANASEWLSKASAGTLWANSWSTVLRRLSGSTAAPVQTFAPGLRHRGTRVPLSMVVSPERVAGEEVSDDELP